MLGHVLSPAEFLRHARYDHALPAPPLRRWVDRYWSVTWELPPGRRHLVTTLDEPAVHLTREWGGVRRAGADGAGTWITGPVTRGRFDVTQTDSGEVVGVRFRLGGTTAFTAAQPAAVRDRTVPAAEWFLPHDGPAPGEPVPRRGSAALAAPDLDAWLLALDPHDAPGFAEFTALVELLADPAVTGTAELERRSGLGTRTLQRSFRRFVGIGPKRMILRSRVSDAVAAIDSGAVHTAAMAGGATGSGASASGASDRAGRRSIADLAHELGWYDQSHFVRDFRAITGSTPSAYARGGDSGGDT
jgi:AraC-like DNA-binding protein